MKNIINDASVNEWFAQQMTSLTPMKMLLALLMEKLLRRDAMGGGDIKLLFMTGTFLGLAANIVCLLLSCLIGIFWGLAATVGKEEKTFPWGPSIAIGAWLALLFGNELAAWYLGLLA